MKNNLSDGQEKEKSLGQLFLLYLIPESYFINSVKTLIYGTLLLFFVYGLNIVINYFINFPGKIINNLASEIMTALINGIWIITLAGASAILVTGLIKKLLSIWGGNE